MPNETTVLANTVTAYGTVLSGLCLLLLTGLMGRQPRRWVFAYLCIFVTGIPTVWYHGFGEGFVPGLFDIGTNLLLGWAMVDAVLGDSFRPGVRRWTAMGLAVFDLVALGARILRGSGARRVMAVELGSFGGFTLLEAALILNSLLAVAFLYSGSGRAPRRARPLLWAATAFFLGGAFLASASNHRVDLGILPWHAAWHVAGAFGFVVLWAYNHMRFVQLAADGGEAWAGRATGRKDGRGAWR